jgi:hypothetical protein
MEYFVECIIYLVYTSVKQEGVVKIAVLFIDSFIICLTHTVS